MCGCGGAAAAPGSAAPGRAEGRGGPALTLRVGHGGAGPEGAAALLGLRAQPPTGTVRSGWAGARAARLGFLCAWKLGT